MMSMKPILGAVAVVCFTAAPARLHAQAMSTFARAKHAASNAVAATNEHTDREQMRDGSSTAPAKPAKTGASVAPRRASAPPAAAKSATSTARSTEPTKAATPGRSPAGRKTAAKTSARPADTPEKGPGKEITLYRETFTYSADGRRDPFVSLIASGDLRPMLSDLRLVTVIYAPQGKSVAVMRDVSTDEQYRVRPGQTLGRMRVARISPKSVTFTIEEYGFSRQEVLALNDTTRARSQ